MTTSSQATINKMKPFGIIYMFLNKINGKVYIGQTTRDFARRCANHKHSAHLKNTKFSRAINKYGFENFDKFILDYTKDRDELDELEKFYIDKFHSVEFGYNSTYGGMSHNMSEETKSKMSKSHTGKTLSELAKRKLSIARMGKLNTNNPQTIFCINNGKMYESYSSAARELGITSGSISHCFKRKTFKTKNFIFDNGDRTDGYSIRGERAKKTTAGRQHSEETKQKIREKSIGRKISDAAKIKIARPGIKNHNSTPVYCANNNRIYESLSLAGKDLGIDGGMIGYCIQVGTFTTKGFTFRKLTPEETLDLQNQNQQTSSAQTSQDLSQ